MSSQLLEILLCNILAYSCALLAIWRKFNNGQYYEGVVLIVIVLDLLGIGYFMAQMLNPFTANDAAMRWLSGFTAFLVPLIYMFHAPAAGQDKVNNITIIQFLATVLLFVPATSIELVPAYAVRYYTQPMDDMGVSIFYRGSYIMHIEWIALILLVQVSVAFYQMRRSVKFVKAHGGRYSPVARTVFIWDINCGLFLAAFFFLPLSFWQHPVMRWVFIVVAAITIAVGCLLIFFGFDLNPVSDEDGQRTSMQDFVAENGELISKLRYLLEEEQIYLERGIQAETVIKRLGTNYVYFDRVMAAQYGISFPEYVHRARVLYAQQLMHKQGTGANQLPLSLDEVAARCGYEDTTTFIRIYTRITGEDPAGKVVQINPLHKEKETPSKEDVSTCAG